MDRISQLHSQPQIPRNRLWRPVGLLERGGALERQEHKSQILTDVLWAAVLASPAPGVLSPTITKHLLF